MNLKKGNKKGFTLIELLVVISIIGILATLLLANFNSARARARDAQRKSDLRNIQTALRLYYNDKSAYPEGSGDMSCGTDSCAWGAEFKNENGTVYMTLLPNDPSSDRKYVYTAIPANDSYTLSACLENLSDDKCDKVSPACSPAYDPNGQTIPTGCKYTVQP